jgi:two-component system response regulator
MKIPANVDEKSSDALQVRNNQPGTLDGSHDGRMAQRNLSESVILLVEDNSGDVALLKRAFSMAGLQHDFLIARDGQEAIDYLSGNDSKAHLPVPTHVLLDLDLPRKNGLEVLGWLRAHSNWSKLPVIVFSGSDLQRDNSEAKRLGVDTLLSKGIEFTDTQAAVARIAEIWNLAPPGRSPRLLNVPMEADS